MQTIRRGSTGPDVVVWQTLLGVVADGIFGPGTEKATKSWQAARGLQADGVVGKLTWAAAGFTEPVPSVPLLGVSAPIPVGDRVIDSLPFSMGGTEMQARALAAAAVDHVWVYSDVASRQVCEHVVNAGMGLMAVTIANEYRDGPSDEIAWGRKVGLPPNTAFALDYEGMTAFEEAKADAPKLHAKLVEWRKSIQGAGWQAGLYLGAPQGSTSREIDELGFDFIWKGLGRPSDRFQTNKYDGLVYPSSGFAMIQQWHGNPHPQRKGGIYWRDTGVFVDTNGAEIDHWGRSVRSAKRARP